jgi:hypothetical protein
MCHALSKTRIAHYVNSYTGWNGFPGRWGCAAAAAVAAICTAAAILLLIALARWL